MMMMISISSIVSFLFLSHALFSISSLKITFPLLFKQIVVMTVLSMNPILLPAGIGEEEM